MTARPPVREVRLYDMAPEPEDLRDEVLRGLQQPLKELPCKLFYDQRGSLLFDQICQLDEYYPTRTETAIMQQFGAEIAALLGPDCALIEYGSGSSTKTTLLLDQLQQPAAYIPIDISKEHLLTSAERLAEMYPSLEILAVCADYTRPFVLPELTPAPARRVIYYPGSTIGNFHPHEAREFLLRMRDVCESNGGLLIGVDLKKDPIVLHRAYNDSQGVTAAFNVNLLARLNRQLGTSFKLDQFRHYAFYNPALGRIEMHLVSLQEQTVQIDECSIAFTCGEPIWTEISYKYTLDEVATLAHDAGFVVKQVWTDDQQLFSVQYLTTN